MPERRVSLLTCGLAFVGVVRWDACGSPTNSFGEGFAAREGAGYVNLASRSRTAHILAGDATGGGHAWFGSGKSFMNGLTGGKSMFPMSWSNSKIMNGVSEVVTSNPWIQQTGRLVQCLQKVANLFALLQKDSMMG